jgi:acyl transferase domain-containing protein/3-hydroxymyristoyl/3-hydroxydecanoyl-(acyl carrier protein) dehydratase
MKFKMNKIAIVSMAGIFPGANNTNQFLQNILEKKESVIKVPARRWVAPSNVMVSTDPETNGAMSNHSVSNRAVSNRAVSDRAISDRAGLVTGFNFDPSGFRVDKDLLASLDPVHHLVLEAGRRAIAQCHMTSALEKRTGVILAAIALPTDTSSMISWEILCQKQPRTFLAADASRASVVSAPAAILARAMGFHGGSFTLDAACASSLVAIKLACEHLSLKKADIMVAGGVSRPDSLYTQVGFTQLQALSPTGCCAPFDRNANGLVVGEGTGIIVLKRLEDALACHDTIHAVITGSGVSNDLEGNLVAPASEGQIRAMVAAYEQAGWTPADIQYMECHGSGTPVGDQVEVTSIKTLLDHYECPKKHLAIGSVKSMIGHLLTAAGAAGFIKTVMSMGKGVLPPSLNFTAPPKNSALNHSNIQVQTNPEPWHVDKPGSTRKAGISAFGFGGINAHILVEEFLNKPSLHFVPKNIELPIFKPLPCAIVGMETFSKNAKNLDEFKDLIFGKSKPDFSFPENRWRRTCHLDPEIKKIPCGFLDELSLGLGEFHIPPNQMEDILPQQLIMLKTARGALEDANILPRPLKTDPDRIKTGCAIGIDFDFGATDFFLRWKLYDQDKSLQDKISPPLTFTRTLGALGGIVASRIAREFKLGGPCFTLSAGAASGIKAIEAAVHSLSFHETDSFLCGCVDLAGDIRKFTMNHAAKPFGEIHPSEGAAALVLKRLDQAIKDNDRIYGVINGVSGSGGAKIPGETKIPKKLEPEKSDSGSSDSGNSDSDTSQASNQYFDSFEKVLKDSNTQFSDLSLIETHSMGIGIDGKAETHALTRMTRSHGIMDNPCYIGNTASILGDTGSVASLFSMIKACLALYHNMLPASGISAESEFIGLNAYGIKIVQTRQVWESPHKKPGQQKPVQKKSRIAVLGSMTQDGACAHAVIEEYSSNDMQHREVPISSSRDDKKTFKIKTTRPLVTEDMIEAIHPPDTRSNIFDPGIFVDTAEVTARAHEKFLMFSQENMAQMESQFKALVQTAAGITDEVPADSGLKNFTAPRKISQPPSPAFEIPVFMDRDKCLEYAVGKAGNVLGPEFDIIDTYPCRVRLPDEPLMLVDRIIDIQGEMLSLTSGKIITQHDVKENAWYLDGGKAPVSISIEAGQADLFLCAYLGIDHAVKGKRKYRLLDAKVTFHRTLPDPGETIEYHIEIDRFLKQGDIYLFFFHYKGYINKQLFISMKNGCAGFFTEEEVENSGGIILKKEDTEKKDTEEEDTEEEDTEEEDTKKKVLKTEYPIKIPATNNFTQLIAVEKTSFPDEKVEALRKGDLETAFGRQFKGVTLGENQWLPGKRMKLIDRVIELDPRGGRFGLGWISAEADIHPDDWFLTCHFIDDMVMPGTLMYECCAHTLRIFVQRMGWVSEENQVHYDVIPFNESDLKCRGPVTRETRKARYEIEIKEMGYNPEPYVIADAHMFSDDLQIVLYKDMGMKINGITRNDLMNFWSKNEI